jgi:hypothetical protein
MRKDLNSPTESQAVNTSINSSAALVQHRSISDVAARIVTEVFNPPWLGIAVLGAVAAHSARSFGDFLLWWAISVVFANLLPLGFLIQSLRQGRVSDWYVTRARERILPFAIAFLSFSAAAVLMVVLSAPQEMLAVTLGGMAGLLVAISLTPKWKLSVHTGSMAGSVVILSLIFGPWALALIPALPLVGWARIKIAHHTVGQVVVGGVIGASVAGAVFLLVTRLG